MRFLNSLADRPARTLAWLFLLLCATFIARNFEDWLEANNLHQTWRSFEMGTFQGAWDAFVSLMISPFGTGMAMTSMAFLVADGLSRWRRRPAAMQASEKLPETLEQLLQHENRLREMQDRFRVHTNIARGVRDEIASIVEQGPITTDVYTRKIERLLTDWNQELATAQIAAAAGLNREINFAMTKSYRPGFLPPMEFGDLPDMPRRMIVRFFDQAALLDRESKKITQEFEMRALEVKNSLIRKDQIR
jgi:hypothetical protein